MSCTSGSDDTSVEKKLFANIKKYMTEDEILSNCWLFYTAGYESTANTLSFAAHELALNPEKQDKLYEEVMSFIDSDGEISYDVLTKMPFLDAVISETLRLHAPAVRLWRYANEDYKLGDTGITIKKGQRIEIPNHGIHHLEEYFPNPKTFSPERFLPENRHKIVPYSYTPFGGGPRHCVGMRFALMEAKLGLAHIMKNYKFITTTNTDIPVALPRNSIIHAPLRVIVGIQKR
jgi:cytochrome P450